MDIFILGIIFGAFVGYLAALRKGWDRFLGAAGGALLGLLSPLLFFASGIGHEPDAKAPPPPPGANPYTYRAVAQRRPPKWLKATGFVSLLIFELLIFASAPSPWNGWLLLSLPGGAVVGYLWAVNAKRDMLLSVLTGASLGPLSPLLLAL